MRRMLLLVFVAWAVRGLWNGACEAADAMDYR